MNAALRSRQTLNQLVLFYITSLACLLGILVFSDLTLLIPLYFTTAYAALLLALPIMARMWRDWLNPLSLILVIGFVRYSLPGFLSFYTEPPMAVFRVMGLRQDDWLLGHALALMGFLGVTLGWLFPAKFSEGIFRRVMGSLSVRFSKGVSYAAIIGMLVGLIGLFIFVQSHMPILEAAYTGEMRGAHIQEGTGKYWYLGLMLIAGGVVFSAYLTDRHYRWWITPMPAIVATVLFWVLGGRARALTSCIAWAILLWYQRKELNVPLKAILVFASVFLPFFFYAGQLYRGGYGVEGFNEAFSVSALVGYVKYTVWCDVGHLHSLAGAVKVGPGILEGTTFLGMLWPLTEFFYVPLKSAGVSIAEMLIGFGFRGRKWGFHAGLIGDAYLNFGLSGVLIVTVIFGIVLRLLYLQMKNGRVNSALYALAVVQSIRIFFESIEKFSETLVLLFFAFCIIRLGQSLFDTLSKSHPKTVLAYEPPAPSPYRPRPWHRQRAITRGFRTTFR